MDWATSLTRRRSARPAIPRLNRERLFELLVLATLTVPADQPCYAIRKTQPLVRHSFVSHALAGGPTLAEVRDAPGQANVSITSGYLHVAVEDNAVGNLFG